jgi:hypothetical protein
MSVFANALAPVLPMLLLSGLFQCYSTKTTAILAIASASTAKFR